MTFFLNRVLTKEEQPAFFRRSLPNWGDQHTFLTPLTQVMETEPLLHLPISIMNVALLGKKIGMTQVFDDSNRLVPVTVIEAGPCPVTQIKSVETDGYLYKISTKHCFRSKTKYADCRHFVFSKTLRCFSLGTKKPP